MAGRETVHQRAETNLMGNACSRETFRDDTDHDAEHGGTAVKEFCTLELLKVKTLGLMIGKPMIIRWGICHSRIWESGWQAWQTSATIRS